MDLDPDNDREMSALWSYQRKESLKENGHFKKGFWVQTDGCIFVFDRIVLNSKTSPLKHFRLGARLSDVLLSELMSADWLALGQMIMNIYEFDLKKCYRNLSGYLKLPH